MEPFTQTGAGHARPHGIWGFLLRELPYLAILLLMLAGVGYATFNMQPMGAYWDFVAVCNCVACIYVGWHYAADRKERFRLVGTQILHWGAFLTIMILLYLPTVQSDAASDITGLFVMLLLALGTFVAGVHTLSWRMALNGVILALFVPVVAWVDRLAFVLLFAAVAVLVIGLFAFLWHRSQRA
ncbi:hypothetical protein [Amorphus sp. 3PC139-8]|uniref:hypothetical protein n=1 Tax=Amorphus sp. 3PC139-8 TaxID=2735676 RepID=UPI00345DC823